MPRKYRQCLICNCIPGECLIDGLRRELAEATRALSLAQTEIKGHMRTIDDLEADLADEAPARFQLQAALKRAQDKWQEAQARIAELEVAYRAHMEALEQARVRFATHTKAVSDFLNELYAIMVDPCAEGTIKVEDMKAELIKAALRSREYGNDLSE
jgi:chromosome segregation ATPase